MAPLARLLRGPPPGPLRRGASSAAAAGAACLYAALGVEPSASLDEIKAAFRRKVRALHPDRAGPDADPAALLAVVEAHGVLADRTRRELYDLDRRVHGWTGLRGEDGAGAAAAAGAPEPEAADREDWTRDVAALRRWEELSDLHPGLKTLDADLRAATRTAFLGPRLEPTIDCAGVAMPEHFEAEERTVALGPAKGAGGDLLAIVHGRTVLGDVRECDVKALQERGLMLPASGAGGGEGPGRDVEGEPLPTLVWESAPGGEPRRTVAVARCRRVDLNGAKQPQVALEVEWPAAEGDGGEAGRFHLRVEWAPELGSHKVLTGREDLAWTHTLMKFKTPFVRHIHIYDRTSGAQLASARRPTLPPAAFWLFPPREACFAGGSWSVECAAPEPGKGAADGGRGFHVAAVLFGEYMRPPGWEGPRTDKKIAAAYDRLLRERGLDALGVLHSLRRRWGAFRERWERPVAAAARDSTASG